VDGTGVSVGGTGVAVGNLDIPQALTTIKVIIVAMKAL
jgi:hypothetical protein